MKKNKSLGINALLGSINTLMSILFSLVTFPYISRVLSVESVGQINFSQSFVSYFTFIAELGIYTFAVREGAKKKSDSHFFAEFANQIFSINILSTLIAFFLLGVVILFPTKIAQYRVIIAILMIDLLLIPFKLEWLFAIFEDFTYVTIRNIFIRIISIVLMFVFVKDTSDAIAYVMLIPVASFLNALVNVKAAKKYVNLKFTKKTNWSEYRKSILTFFANSVATFIYLSSDTTLLGLIKGDFEVGIYSAATKIYFIVKRLFNAAIANTIPRLYSEFSNDKTRFIILSRRIIATIVLFVFPAGTGLILLSEEIIVIIAGNKYLASIVILKLLSIAMIVAVLSCIIVNGILIVVGKEKLVLNITIVSAFVNVLLNFVFIPLWGANGAALTTLIAELVVFVFANMVLRNYFKELILEDEAPKKIRETGKVLWPIRSIINATIGCVVMYALDYYWVHSLFKEYGVLISLIINIIFCVFIYSFTLFLLREKYFIDIIKGIRDKINL